MSQTSFKAENTTRQDTDAASQNGGGQRPENLRRRLFLGFAMLVILQVIVCGAVVAVHWPALNAEAMSFDDDQYIERNILVNNPGWPSVRRFLTEVLEPSTVRGYYQPLTMISLMLDSALGGSADELRVFHRTNIALHTVNTAILILLLYLLFGRALTAAVAGLLFGLHPMVVEPVVWVCQRKTLLMYFFVLWLLVFYVRFSRKSDWRFYAGAVLTYILALASKPTAVSVPVLMLLMDYWPLRRLNARCFWEKVPFFLIAGISAVITYISQSRTAFIAPPTEYAAGHIPLIVCHNIVFYLYKIIWPANLSSYYGFPMPFTLSNPAVLAGVIGTCILIILLVISMRWTPAAVIGWLFFFVAILPTMGVVAFTDTIAANRFVYLPSVGLVMILACFSGWLSSIAVNRRRRILLLSAVLILAGAEAAGSRRYLTRWRDTITYYRHMLTLAGDAAPLHVNIGIALLARGKVDEAIGHQRRALELRPNYAKAHYNLGNALLKQDKINEAVSHYRQAIRLRQGFVAAHNNLGYALQSQGRVDEAVGHYRQALKFKPGDAITHYNLANALRSQGSSDEAVRHFRKALQDNPYYAEAYNNLGIILFEQGKSDEAVNCFRQAVRLKADYIDAYTNLAVAYKQTGRADESLQYLTEALRLKADFMPALKAITEILAAHPNLEHHSIAEAVVLLEHSAELTGYKNVTVLECLATAYAADKQFERAAEIARKALEPAKALGNDELVNRLRKQRDYYKQQCR